MNPCEHSYTSVTSSRFQKTGFSRRKAGLGLHHQGASFKWVWGINSSFAEASGTMSGDRLRCQESWLIIQILQLTSCIILGKICDLPASIFFYRK